MAAWFEVHHRDCARRQGAMTTSFEIPHHRHRSPLGDLLATGGVPGPPGTKGIASGFPRVGLKRNSPSSLPNVRAEQLLRPGESWYG